MTTPSHTFVMVMAQIALERAESLHAIVGDMDHPTAVEVPQHSPVVLALHRDRIAVRLAEFGTGDVFLTLACTLYAGPHGGPLLRTSWEDLSRSLATAYPETCGLVAKHPDLML